MTEKLLPDGSYLSKIYEMLNRIEQQEQEPMEAAAEAAYHSIKNGGLLHVFSTGHSHMIVEEMFYRSGGLVPINPILSDELMLHTGAITSTQIRQGCGGLGQGIPAKGRHDHHLFQHRHQHRAG